MRHIRVIVRHRMLRNVVRRWIIRRITRNHLLPFILVNPQVIQPHRRRHQRSKSGQIQRCEAVTHPKVDYHRHWFLRDNPLSNVAVGANSARIQCPGSLITDPPGNGAVGAGRVFEAISLVGLLVVPMVVKILDAGDSLLVHATAVGVHGRDVRVVKLNEVCLLNQYVLTLLVRLLQLTVVRTPEHVKGCTLVTLRCGADSCLIWRVEICHGCFYDIDFWSASRYARARVIFTGASTRRKTHAWQEIYATCIALIWRNTRVANIIVAIRPHSVSRRRVPRPTKIAHGPDTRPETNGISSSR